MPSPHSCLAGVILAGGGAASVAYHAAKRVQDRRLVSRLRGAPAVEPLAGRRRVSILVAAWNEAALILRHVESVRSLRYPKIEHILCAGGADGSYALARRLEDDRLTVLEQLAGEGKQAALRRCLARAGGNLIFLTDADCLLDDEAFEATIAPLLRGEVDAATGGSRPLPEQVSQPLVAYRWAADSYVHAHAGAGADGLLGRNAAVTRSALQAAGDFQEDVASGTDYHLAKSLLASGARIRHVRSSQVATRYAESLPDYARQQRRWLRNLVLHGARFGASRDMARSMASSFVGLAVLTAPLLAGVLGRAQTTHRAGRRRNERVPQRTTLAVPVLSLWAVVVLHSSLGKLRYVAFASAWLDGPHLTLRLGLGSLWATFADSVAAVVPLLDYLIPRRRLAW